MVGRQLQGRSFSGRESLWTALQSAFAAIDPAFVYKLYKTMPDRMRAVQAAKGAHTRY